jgi:hypothetical protein
MNYETLAKSDVLVVSPDPRKSPDEFWLRKMGVLVDTPIYVRLLKFCVGIAVCCVCYKRRRQIKSRFIMGIVSMRASKNKKKMRKKDSDIHLKDRC